MQEIVYKKDWDKICAMYKWQENLAEDPAGFGDTNKEAKFDLIAHTPQVQEEIEETVEEEKQNALIEAKPFGVKITIAHMVDDMPHEVAVVHLRSKTQFTKETIDNFIASDKFIQTAKESMAEEFVPVVFYVLCNA